MKVQHVEKIGLNSVQMTEFSPSGKRSAKHPPIVIILMNIIDHLRLPLLNAPELLGSDPDLSFPLQRYVSAQ